MEAYHYGRRKGVSKPRSESLIRIMRELGYSERTRHGVLVLFKYMLSKLLQLKMIIF